ncbi:TonB-dependent receptor domain-containing protein [Niveispirillum lacus]|nr:TonB-dependent receptor [Niveispirillum lacus]
MKIQQKLPGRAIRAALLTGVAATFVNGSTAIAQSAPAAGAEPLVLEEIIVTGSRIASPNATSPVPVTSVTAEQLVLKGNVSLGDAMNKLPSFRSTFSQANSTAFIGTAGLNVLDLRGQGTARTLVMVNGRRHITAQPGSFTVDTNTIPSDLLERVDVVTGGNSAVYGSDAVAGVVNFVTKRNFEGTTARLQVGTSGKGDRDSYTASVATGISLDEGRGNFAMSFEMADSDTLYFTDRDSQTGAFSGRSQFNLTENVIGEPSTGNGTADRTFLRGIRNITISEGGLYTSTCPALPATTAANYAAVVARRALNCTGQRSNTGAELGKTFVFNDSGQLVENVVTTDFRPFGSGNSIGGQGSTLRLTGMLQPGLERKSSNIIAHYEVAPAFRPFIEAKYVEVTANQEGQPTFHNNSFSIDNPFLSAASRALLVNSLAPGATTFTAQRFNVDFGGRGEQHTRDTYRIVVGADGEFNDDWRYEASINYGHVDTYYETNGNIITAKFNNARDAVRNAAGTIVCRVNADASTTNDDPSCVPVNLFGNGSVSREALNYFGYTSSRKQQATEFVGSAFVSGDSSQLFELPAGPASFAIGGEYRRETAYSIYDDVTASGVTFLNAFAPFRPPAMEVTEGFAELRVPLLADLPFAEELSLNGSGRLSHYNNDVGTVFAYNFGGTYAPTSDIRFRSGYARSVRAPTLLNLHGASTQGFVNGLNDPCSANNINNNPNRRTNCAAARVPTTEVVNGVTVPWTNTPASGVSGVSSGNPDLTEERGTSITIGFVATPDFIDGLTLSADYYSIKIKDVINTLGGQTIIDQCYDSPSGINNAYCAAVFRNADGTFAGQSNRIVGGATVSFPTTGPAYRAGPFNFANQKTEGIDVDLTYEVMLTDDIKADFRTLVSYLIKRDEFTDITLPDYRTQVKGTLGDPEWSGTFDADFKWKEFNIGYGLRYIGKQAITDWEVQHAVDGRPATNPDGWPRKYYSAAYLHDIRFGYEVTEEIRLYGGVDNFTNSLPPFDLLGTTDGEAYDNIGRYFYLGVQAKF